MAKSKMKEYVLVKPAGKDATDDTRYARGSHPSVFMKYDKKAGGLKCPAPFLDFILASGQFELIDGEELPIEETTESAPDATPNDIDPDGGIV